MYKLFPTLRTVAHSVYLVFSKFTIIITIIIFIIIIRCAEGRYQGNESHNKIFPVITDYYPSPEDHENEKSENKNLSPVW